MKVALIADAQWLDEEAALFGHLLVGIAEEQVTAVPVLPENHPQLPLTFVTQRLTYRSSRFRWLRQWSAHRLHPKLAEMDIDVVHAVHGSMQGAAQRLGETLNVPVVCSFWSARELEYMVDRKESDQATPPMAYTLGSPALLEFARQTMTDSPIMELVRPGVLSTEVNLPAPLADPESSLSVLVVTDGHVDAHCQALLQGIALVKSNLPQLQVFIYTPGADQHRMWMAAAKLDLLNQVNVVKPEPGARRLLVQADALLLPQPMRRVRTLVLQAMLAGRPVIAAVDPTIDYLIEGKTARLLAEISPERWAEHLQQLTTVPGAYRSLGGAARQYVKEQHTASGFVNGIIEVYQKATAAPLPFDKAAAADSTVISDS